MEGVTVVVSAANSAARKRPRTSGQGHGAVEDQAAQAAPRQAGPGPRNSDEHGSEARSDADAGLTAVDRDDDDPEDAADREEFDDLDDTDDAEIQAALAKGDLDEPDITDVVAVADDLAGDDELAVDEVDGPEAADGMHGSEPDQPSAESDAEADGAGGSEGSEAPGARVVKISPDGGDDEEIYGFGDDDDDLPAAQVAVAGATAAPVKDYLQQIGKVPLLNAEP